MDTTREDDEMSHGNLKSVKVLAGEGQKYLNETMDATCQIFAAMTNELCKIVADASSDISHYMGGGELDEARIRCKSSVASLRAVVSSMPDSQLVAIDSSSSQTDEILTLEKQTFTMRMELAEKNKHLKHLLDQTRDLITDITTWETPRSVLRRTSFENLY